MKKFIKLSILIVIFFLSVLIVKGAANSITITSNTSKVVVGNKVTYTVKITSAKSLIALQYSISYDTSKLTLISGTAKGVDYYTGPRTSATYTFTFRAKASGTANFTFKAEGAAYSTDESINFGSKSKSISIITQQQLEASYSKNNNLTYLEVTGYKITPVFNANTTNYNLVVENDVREVIVKGTLADSRSTVKGLGKHSLEEGINKIVVTVTAQNGVSKNYTINIEVKELEPIIVEIEGVKYNVVRKAKLLTKPNSLFIEKNTKIGEFEVPSFYNEVSNITLVGLKDERNDIHLYEFNNGKYILYNELKFSEIITVFKKLDKIPKGYNETKIKYNDKEYIAYKKDNIYLINLLNLKTGKTKLYRFDNKEGTIQGYNLDEENEKITLEKNNKIYIYIIIILSGIIFTTYSVLIGYKIKKNLTKKKKKIENNDKIKEEKNKGKK